MILADGTVFPRARPHRFHESGLQHGDRHVPRARRRSPNPKGTLRPGQFVRARVFGRGAAECDPRAAARGAAGRRRAISCGWSTRTRRRISVWSKSANGTATTGSSTTACKPGERVVVDGAIRVVADAPLKISRAPPAGPRAPDASAAQTSSRTAQRDLRGVRPTHAATTERTAE